MCDVEELLPQVTDMFWSAAGPLRSVSPRVFSRLRCPLHTSRSFSTSAGVRSLSEPESRQPLRQWALAVSPFSSVRAHVGCSVSVRPLDPHAFPEADRAFITVHGTGTDPDQELCVDQCHVLYDDQSRELRISADGVHSGVSIDLRAPIKSNLFITTQGEGHVHVKKMECDVCKVQTEQGSCTLHSVKGHQVQVKTKGGHVTGLGTIHGNVDIITSGDSVVDVKKLQGTRMNVSTERGSLKVKAIYAESSCVSSCSGRVELGHVHGNAAVKNVSGDTVIDGSNSFLKVSSHSGDIDIYVGEGGTAEILSEEGSVCVRVPSSLRAGVELCGASVDVSPEVVLHGAENNTSEGQTTVTGFINGEPLRDQWVKARANGGSVRLKTQSWFESLKLGG